MKEELSLSEELDFAKYPPPVFPPLWKRSYYKFEEGSSVMILNVLVQDDNKQEHKGTVVDLICVDRYGFDVTIHCYGFNYYFYLRPHAAFDVSDLAILEKEVKYYLEKIEAASDITFEIVKKTKLIYYKEKPTTFIKVVFSNPLIEDDLLVYFEDNYSDTFNFVEENVDPNTRFIADNNLYGGTWIKLHNPKPVPIKNRTTRSNEIDIDLCDIEPFEDASVPPIRILTMSLALDRDENIWQIGASIWTQGDTSPIGKISMCVGQCKKVLGVSTYNFQTEEQMLEAFSDFVEFSNPDILSSFNIERDLNLIMWKYPRFNFARCVFTPSVYGEDSISDYWRIELGVQRDIENSCKLESYSLCAISIAILNKPSPEIKDYKISAIHKRSPETISKYLHTQIEAMVQIMEKRMMVVNAVEIARACKLTVSRAVNAGELEKVMSQLLTLCSKENIITKQASTAETRTYGGLVLNPEGSYFENPIVCIDFASLYPTIMIAYNICYTTLIKPDDIELLDGIPVGSFVSAETKLGILPQILKALLEKREKAKRLMVEDPAHSDVYQCRQQALKISANAVYGCTAARGGFVVPTITNAITLIGQKILEFTRDFVISKGYKVVYGDTDSLMIDFGCPLKEALTKAEALCGEINGEMPAPINIRVEKAYWPMCIVSKKRYAGILYSKDGEQIGLDMKGLEGIRRDSCLLARKAVEMVLTKWLKNGDPKDAIKSFERILGSLNDGDVDPYFLILSKSVNKSVYKIKQPHIEMANRRYARDQTPLPMPGERLSYLVVEKGKNAKLHEKSEDPRFAVSMGLPIDVAYYQDKQLVSPVSRIFKEVPSVADAINGLKTGKFTNGAPSYADPEDRRQVSSIKRARLLEERSRIQTECSRCQGSLFNLFECDADDCPMLIRGCAVENAIKNFNFQDV